MPTPPHRILESSRVPESSALPKINVHPAPEETASAGGRGGASLPGRRGWDVKFALALIFLVVLVNATLTLLLGEEGDPGNSGNTPTMPPGKPVAAATATASRETKDTKIFISSEDKRVLLRQLNTARKPAAARTGAYHSLGGDGDALSIIGTGNRRNNEDVSQ